MQKTPQINKKWSLAILKLPESEKISLKDSVLYSADIRPGWCQREQDSHVCRELEAD